MTITTEEAEALAKTVWGPGLPMNDARRVANALRALAAERDMLRDRAEGAEAGNLSKVHVGEWQECLEPIIARFEVTGALGDDFTAVHNSKGSAALGKLFRKMSQTLDAAVDALARAERAEAKVESLQTHIEGTAKATQATMIQLTKRAAGAEAEAEKLREVARNFWAFVRGEYGVRLSSEDQEEHNVAAFLSMISPRAALEGGEAKPDKLRDAVTAVIIACEHDIAQGVEPSEDRRRVIAVLRAALEGGDNARG